MIQAKFRKLYLRLNGAWVPIGCLTANGFSESSDMFETTVRLNGGYRSYVPLMFGYTVSFDGIAKNSVGDPNVISLDRLRSLMRSKTVVSWKLETDDSSMLDFGSGYIVELSDTANVGDFVTFSGSIQGTGEIYNIEDDPNIIEGPGAPFLSFLNATEDYIRMDWTVPSSAFPITQFRVYRDNVLYTTVNYNGIGSTVEYSDLGVVAGASYSYNVSAVDSNGTEGPLSNRIINTSEIPDAGNNFLLYESYPDGGDIIAIKANILQLENNDLLAYEA